MFDPQGPSFLELTRQALSSTTRGYDLLASKFEHTPFRTPDALLAPMIASIGPLGSLTAALDACCGTGAALSHLRPLCTSHVCGIDLSQGMLDQARALLSSAPGDAEVRLQRADALSMTFDQEFDVVTCCGAFGHILHPDQDAFVDGVWRALRPGGRFVFLTAPMPSPRQLSWWFSRGFNAVMHARNALRSPPFIMFYLTFTTERARVVLERRGFHVEIKSTLSRVPTPSPMQILHATRPP